MLESETIAPISTVTPDAVATALARRVKAMPKPCFAVMDGARFPDLPGHLAERSLPHRSLFLDHADIEVERAGAWLVPLARDVDVDTLIGLMAAMPAAVFWSCPDGEAALYRHLRTLNLVIVPLPHDEGAPADVRDAPPDPTASPAAFKDETVMFRHADPNVMASLLPLLDTAQFARIFGPASQMVMLARDYGGLRHAPRPDDLPIAPAGLLRIREDQMEALEAAKAEKSRRKIAAFLREVDPVHTAGMTDAALAAFVIESETSGRELGMTTERALGQWAFVNLRNRGRVASDPRVRDYFLHYDGAGDANDKMSILLDKLGALPDKR